MDNGKYVEIIYTEPKKLPLNFGWETEIKAVYNNDEKLVGVLFEDSMEAILSMARHVKAIPSMMIAINHFLDDDLPEEELKEKMQRAFNEATGVE